MPKPVPVEIEKTIARVMRQKDLTRPAAIEYMMSIAAGRLAALWRYDDSLPEGKQSKGVLAPTGRKKRAERSTAITHKIAKRAARQAVSDARQTEIANAAE